MRGMFHTHVGVEEACVVCSLENRWTMELNQTKQTTDECYAYAPSCSSDNWLWILKFRPNGCFALNERGTTCTQKIPTAVGVGTASAKGVACVCRDFV